MASKWMGRVVTVTAWMTMGMSSVQAAEKIRWEDLQKRVGQAGELRSASTLTRDGQKYHAQKLSLNTDLLTLYTRDKIVKTVPRRDVARVEIRQRKRYYRHIGESLFLSVILPLASIADISNCSGGSCIGGLLLTPPLWAYTAVSAPVFLAADAVAFLMPAEKFDLVP